MSFRDDPALAVRVGDRTVGEALDAAIDAGDVVRLKNGNVRLRSALPALDEDRSRVVFFRLFARRGDFRQNCRFLNDFLFDVAYDKSAVPAGCRDCYKVKVITPNLRQARAVHRLTQTVSQSAKTGVEQPTRVSGLQFASYFYNLGLDRARVLHADLRAKIDHDPALGPDVTMVIKRGCSNYEAHCGPSDRYVFNPALEQAELRLRSLFSQRRPGRRERLELQLRRLAGYLRILGVTLRHRLGLMPRKPEITPLATVTYSAVPPRDTPPDGMMGA